MTPAEAHSSLATDGINQAVANRLTAMTIELGREVTTAEAHSSLAAMGGGSYKIEDGRGTCELDGCGLLVTIMNKRLCDKHYKEDCKKRKREDAEVVIEKI